MKNLQTPRAQRVVPDSFQAYLVNGATFTENEEYPVIPEWMIAKEIPKAIMPFNKAICFKGDLSKTYISFFSADATFERVRQNPKRYIEFFKRTAGIIGFDYSIHSDMPIIKQKSQMYDNLSLTYYFGSLGIPIIPNIRCGIDELLPEFLSCIPKNNIIAVGTYGFIKERYERYEWFCFLEKIIEELSPNIIVVYGSLPGKLFEDLKSKTEFIFFEPYMKTRWKEVKKNGN